jgi:predicted nuclease of predicted toxin-antitoxin system
VRIIVDESVALAVAEDLAGKGHEVTHVAASLKGAADDAVWALAVSEGALLVTRDHHFTDPAKRDPAECLGIVYLRKGNLSVDAEAALVSVFFDRHGIDEYRGRLVTLSPNEMRIR